MHKYLEFRGNAHTDSTVEVWAMGAYALAYGRDLDTNTMQVELK